MRRSSGVASRAAAAVLVAQRTTRRSCRSASDGVRLARACDRNGFRDGRRERKSEARRRPRSASVPRRLGSTRRVGRGDRARGVEQRRRVVNEERSGANRASERRRRRSSSDSHTTRGPRCSPGDDADLTCRHHRHHRRPAPCDGGRPRQGAVIEWTCVLKVVERSALAECLAPRSWCYWRRRRPSTTPSSRRGCRAVRPPRPYGVAERERSGARVDGRRRGRAPSMG